MAEVENLHAVAALGQGREHDIARLHIAVDDIFFMSGRESLQALRGEITEGPLAHRLNQVLECGTQHQLHHEKNLHPLLENIVDHHDIWVVEVRDDTGLAQG